MSKEREKNRNTENGKEITVSKLIMIVITQTEI